MKISARNQLTGKVTLIKKGVVNSEIEMSLENNEKIISVITNDGVESLGIKEGLNIFSIFKAQSVLVVKSDSTPSISARNKLKGTVNEIIDGVVNCEVKIATVGGAMITAVVTEDAKKELELKKGDNVFAVIKASSILLGVE